MASRTRIRQGITLEEFLTLPEDKPYLEYIDGRIEAKVSPQTKHSLLTKRFVSRLDDWSEQANSDQHFPELPCTFAGRSIIPDVVFLKREHIEIDDQGETVNEVLRPPDIHIEIISPDQSVKKSREKLAHATSNGCPLGWLIDPKKKTVDVFRAGQSVARLAPDGILEGEPVLPGFRLPVAEVFGWLRLGF